ncbi:MAG: hypothetical protein HQL80_12045, partial [Magnetococcales bacterium]|nr:hypothetical protein [Magnetococcales bacterium]
MTHSFFQWAVQDRSALFARFSVATWMRLTSGVSLTIFLAVILLNHFSLSAIQQINRDLYQGFHHKDGWRRLSLEVAQAENIRLTVQSSLQVEGVKAMQALIADLFTQVDGIGNGSADAIRADIRAYATAFDQLADAVAQKGALRLTLAKNRESLEIQIYEFENRTLESVLNEFILAETEYLSNPDEERLNSLQVILDRLARDASESVSKTGHSLDVMAYEQTLAAMVEKNAQVVRSVATMERTAQKITGDVGQQME